MGSARTWTTRSGVLEDRSLEARPAARQPALRAAATEIFDVVEITRRSRGRHWRAAPPAERGELVPLFTALLERACVGRVEQFDSELAGVRTRLVSRNGTETAVDYRLHRVGDRWLAYDVSVEGVSPSARPPRRGSCSAGAGSRSSGRAVRSTRLSTPTRWRWQ